MKRKIPLWAALCGCLVLCALCCALLLTLRPALPTGNFTNEMKLPNTHPLHDEGADVWDRVGDHGSSPYFYNLDFYNLKSTDSRSLLPQFKTMQQSAWWSCGPTSILMVLDYYGVLGDWNEENLAALRSDHSQQHTGTCLEQMIEILDHVGGFDLVTTYDYRDNLEELNMAFFRQQIQAGYPVLVGWNDWGGHWEVIIGYDTMGTEHEGDDVLIFADSFDTSDHNQDGYGVVSAERFIDNFTFYDFLPADHIRDKCLIVVKPQVSTEAEK
ncbi:MAG: papain-like cysteine protease family protein [Oscillospiraceae bacterium]